MILTSPWLNRPLSETFMDMDDKTYAYITTNYWRVAETPKPIKPERKCGASNRKGCRQQPSD